ncbi:MAG: ATP-binding protein, partial [Holophagales bacterium]|nr:ATP-binding protein [Holophagales bacterium]
MSAGEPRTNSRLPAETRLAGGWYWLAFVALGLISLAGLLAASLSRQERVIADVVAVEQLGQVQADVAICHLWVEELVTGDRVDLGELDSRLARADHLLGALQTEIASGNTTVEIVTRDHLADLRGWFEQFRAITEDRRVGYTKGLAVGIGSSFDVEYDRVFAELLARIDAVSSSLRARRDRSRRRDARVVTGLLGAWAATLLLAAASLWHREQRRRETALALAESEGELLRSRKSETLGRLASGLAHDINNYLAAIRSQCELALVRGEASEEVKGAVSSAIGTVSKASALIDRLLGFGRRAARARHGDTDGEVAGEPADREVVSGEIVHLGRILGSMEPMLGPVVGERIELRLSVEEQTWPVRIDPVALEQAVVNLVLNAVDALPRGGHIWVHAHNEPSAAGDRVVMRVDDDGPGIAAEERERIFEPFVSSKRGAGGHAGLGLAIVEATVAEAGGSVRAGERPGGGARFEIRLPRLPADAGEPPVERRAGAEGNPPIRPAEVLLVGDNEELREATAMYLETLGHRVVTAAGVTAALEAMARGELEPGASRMVLVADVVLGDG